jgi:hypothetical protein
VWQGLEVFENRGRTGVTLALRQRGEEGKGAAVGRYKRFRLRDIFRFEYLKRFERFRAVKIGKSFTKGGLTRVVLARLQKRARELVERKKGRA